MRPHYFLQPSKTADMLYVIYADNTIAYWLSPVIGWEETNHGDNVLSYYSARRDFHPVSLYQVRSLFPGVKAHKRIDTKVSS